MEILGIVLQIVGFIIFAFGGIWFVVESFRESVWWGLAVMFIPFAETIFLILHWRVASKPFGFQLLGMVILFLAKFISESGFSVGI